MQGFSIGDEGNFAPHGTYGNIWRRFWLSYWTMLGIKWIEAKDAAKYPLLPRAVSSITKNFLIANVKSVQVEKT